MKMSIKSYTDCFDEYNGNVGTCTIEKDVLLLPFEDGYCITYLNMVITNYFKNGRITVYSDVVGTQSVRHKMNKYTPDCINVIQRDHELFVEFYGIRCPFVNGKFTCDPEKKDVYYESLGL